MFGRPSSAAALTGYDRLCTRDRTVVEALWACGADLDRERHVIHFIEVPNGRAADRVAALGAQWETAISPPAEGAPGWFVSFERHDRVLTPTNIKADRHLFEVIASVHRGRYEGWEVAAQ